MIKSNTNSIKHQDQGTFGRNAIKIIYYRYIFKTINNIQLDVITSPK